MNKPETTSVGFLLTQVGAHANHLLAERLEPTKLTPAHAGSLWAVEANEGISQQVLAERLGSHPSRIVALIDDLQTLGLVERKQSETDRRTHALHLTAKGRGMVRTLGKIAREQQDALCSPLTERERVQLAALLQRIADAQGLMPGVHPGFRTRHASK
jgi:DNA-binding MarR family transcriptional regulator